MRKIDPNWVEKLHVVDTVNNGDTNGFLDIRGGITIADKVKAPSHKISLSGNSVLIIYLQACVYARFLCEKAGVQFVLGDPKGKFVNFITETNGTEKKVKGIKTADGLRHLGDLVIAAGRFSHLRIGTKSLRLAYSRSLERDRCS